MDNALYNRMHQILQQRVDMGAGAYVPEGRRQQVQRMRKPVGSNDYFDDLVVAGGRRRKRKPRRKVKRKSCAGGYVSPNEYFNRMELAGRVNQNYYDDMVIAGKQPMDYYDDVVIAGGRKRRRRRETKKTRKKQRDSKWIQLVKKYRKKGYSMKQISGIYRGC